LGNKLIPSIQTDNKAQGWIKPQSALSDVIQAFGRLNNSKAITNDKQERLKIWEGSPNGVVTRKATTQVEGYERKPMPLCNEGGYAEGSSAV